MPSSINSRFSLIACVLVCLVLIQYRLLQPNLDNGPRLNVLSWDAFGYYMFLPGAFIYQDIEKFDWIPEIDKKYNATGGEFYQAQQAENGNYVGKYFVGLSILELPFFWIGHAIAINSHYNADGFSPPYQYSIAFGSIFYCILALFLLRTILLRYYSDKAAALSLFLLVMATNFIQFVAIDSAQSHAFIFPLYVLLLYFTIKWHDQPKKIWAVLIGLTIGVATLCRPTEAIMVFIPLLWNMQDSTTKTAKWKMVRDHIQHVYWAIVGGIIGILPQLIYWKIVSGDFIFNVGSKWYFLNPFFRVIVGFENGWMVYTPITILFVVGFFFIKKQPFKKSVITFCLLNIWIITAWSDWKYGATYSTRALVQSYPIFALAFTAVVERILNQKWRFAFLIVGAYLIFVNLFQMEQYYKTILHYRDMNFHYYGRIYLNSSPTPLDMSLMDTDEVLDNLNDYKLVSTSKIDTPITLVQIENYSNSLLQLTHLQPTLHTWVRIRASIQIQDGFHETYLNCKLVAGNQKKERRIRLFNPISQGGAINEYEFFVKVPTEFDNCEAALYLTTGKQLNATVHQLEINHFVK